MLYLLYQTCLWLVFYIIFIITSITILENREHFLGYPVLFSLMNTNLEFTRILNKAHEWEVASIRPTMNCYPTQVKITCHTWQPMEHLHLIWEFNLPKPSPEPCLPGSSSVQWPPEITIELLCHSSLWLVSSRQMANCWMFPSHPFTDVIRRKAEELCDVCTAHKPHPIVMDFY